MRSLPLTYHLVHPKQVGGVNNIASWLSFSAALYLAFTKAELPLDDANGLLYLGTDAGFHVFDVDGRFVLARMLLQGFTLPGRSAISQSTSTSTSSSRCGAPWLTGIGWTKLLLSMKQITQLIGHARWPRW